MKYPVITIALLALLLSARSAELDTIDFSEVVSFPHATRVIKWPKRTIEINFSLSLLAPNPAIKPGSDVIGAARRALLRWSSMSNINFVVTWSTATSVSAIGAPDGVSLLTIADTPENEAFNADTSTGRTRVFFDPESGVIAEADISINPHPRTQDGAELQFSTDGTPGTFDLEATITHEVGHFLGLDHSKVLASTMQSRQAFNGMFGMPALTERTLSEDDRRRVRSLYGTNQRTGSVEGALLGTSAGGVFTPLSNVGVWAEDLLTGRVVASDVTDSDGTYRLKGLPVARYRILASTAERDDVTEAQVLPLRDFEISPLAMVRADATTVMNYNVVQTPNPVSQLVPRLVGIKGELSTVAIPAEPGKRLKMFVSGEGVDQVPATSISINSPFFAVDPTSLAREQIATGWPVISFDVSIAPETPFGDYSLRLQSNSGETSFLPGVVTVDPGVLITSSNPIDDARFFVAQHFKDLLGREPESATLENFASQLLQCAGRTDCLRTKRVEVSTALFLQHETALTSVLNALYVVGLGRRPRFAEFENDRNALLSGANDADAKRALVDRFVRRNEFQLRHPASIRGGSFVNAVVASINQNFGLDVAAQRDALTGLYDGTTAGRAAILSRLISDPNLVEAQYSQAFVLGEYFTYLRRDPDETGYSFWVKTLKSKPTRDPQAARSMICAFLNSTEYQQRFSMSVTHSSRDCDN
ncbi:MAG: matrixin family metalloprotease [Pyrinomonadaceae bacterium]